MAGHILVVDDDRVIRELVVAALEVEGYRVSSATDVPSGLAKFWSMSPNLVLLDLLMPGDGVVFAARVIERKVPIVVMSGRPDGRRLADQIGADGFLAKPFEIDDLLATVAPLCR